LGRLELERPAGAWDESKLAMDNYLPGLADGSAEGERPVRGQAAVLRPSNWGTESLVVNTADAKLSSPPSLGDLFNPDNPATLRPHSALAAMGRWLDATGKLPRPWMDGYTDMAAMVELWDIALAEADQGQGQRGAVVDRRERGQRRLHRQWRHAGLCWDSTGYNLRNDGFAYTSRRSKAPSPGTRASS
jgi:spermidine/putrescine transport system substrate-binding protein